MNQHQTVSFPGCHVTGKAPGTGKCPLPETLCLSWKRGREGKPLLGVASLETKAVVFRMSPEASLSLSTYTLSLLCASPDLTPDRVGPELNQLWHPFKGKLCDSLATPVFDGPTQHAAPVRACCMCVFWVKPVPRLRRLAPASVTLPVSEVAGSSAKLSL